jgi:hypothetical protein
VEATDDYGVAGFEITGGNDDGFFEITSDGLLKLTEAGADDAAGSEYIGSNRFELEIAAFDEEGNASSTQTTIQLRGALTATSIYIEAKEIAVIEGNIFEDGEYQFAFAPSTTQLSVTGLEASLGWPISVGSAVDALVSIFKLDSNGDFVWDAHGYDDVNGVIRESIVAESINTQVRSVPRGRRRRWRLQWRINFRCG